MEDSSSSASVVASAILNDFTAKHIVFPKMLLQTCKTLLVLLKNASTKNEDKYKTIKLSNKTIQRDVVQVTDALDVLAVAGFAVTANDCLVYTPVDGSHDMATCLCALLQDKIQELQVAETTKKPADNPFLSQEERKRRSQKAKAARKANEEARKAEQRRWQEDKQERLEAARLKEEQAQMNAQTTGLSLQELAASRRVRKQEVASNDADSHMVVAEQVSTSSENEQQQPVNLPPVDLEADELWKSLSAEVCMCGPANGVRDSSVFKNKGDSRPVTCLKRLYQELQELSSSLPNDRLASIFIRFDEETPQFLRALVTAPLGTPYAGGMFCFDVYIPNDYPQVPPKVTLLTTGGGRVRFGPNLYADGKVCLSLLGTWPGPKWSPSHSNLYQVLVSIQALILGAAQPYYLEPGHGGWEGDVKDDDYVKQGQTLTGKKVKSEVGVPPHLQQYNQVLRVGTVRFAMLETMTGSKRHLEMFKLPIQIHFYCNRTAILQEVQSWPVTISSPPMDEQQSSFPRFNGSPSGNLKDLVPKLEQRLSALADPSCSQSSSKVAAKPSVASPEPEPMEETDSDPIMTLMSKIELPSKAAPKRRSVTFAEPLESKEEKDSDPIMALMRQIQRKPEPKEENGPDPMALMRQIEADKEAKPKAKTTLKPAPTKKRNAEHDAMQVDDAIETPDSVAIGDRKIAAVPVRKSAAAKKRNAKRDAMQVDAVEGSKTDALKAQMQEAASSNNFVLAGQLQEQLNQLEDLERRMQEAAAKGNFIRAGRLQEQIKALSDTSAPAGPTEYFYDGAAQSENHNGFGSFDSDDSSGNQLPTSLGGLPVGNNVFAPPGHPSNYHTSGKHNWGSGSALSSTTSGPTATVTAPLKEATLPNVVVRKAPPASSICRLRFRLPDNATHMEDFDRNSHLSHVYSHLESVMSANNQSTSSRLSGALGGGSQAHDVAPPLRTTGAWAQPQSSAGFTLLLSHPKREFNLEMQGTKTLAELGLVPSATLTIMMCADRGLARRGEVESRLAEANGGAMDVDGLSYEGLLELTERVGAAKPTALTPELLDQNSTLLSPYELKKGDEDNCPICLGEYDPTDTNKTLRKLFRCGHLMHASCLATWLGTRSTCPICKSDIAD